MYLKFLQNDLRRKRTMNIILFIFIMLAAMFIASSLSNISIITTALDGYIKKSNAPDLYFITVDGANTQSEEMAFENLIHNTAGVTAVRESPAYAINNGENSDLAYDLLIGTPEKTMVNLFQADGSKLIDIPDGEAYVSLSYLAMTGKKIGDTIDIKTADYEKSFTITATVKDIIYGSFFMSIKRAFISEADFAEISGHSGITECNLIGVDTENEKTASEINTEFNNLNYFALAVFGKSAINMMYFMDLLIAAVFIIVSVILVIISFVILHFTITFTISEEFREIGVMKALGITPLRIRSLYLVKYIIISIFASLAGVLLSFPLAKFLLRQASQNMLIEENGSVILNIFAGILVAIIVVFYSYFCTSKINKLTPIAAIRSGNMGETFTPKTFFSLSKSKLRPVLFMSVNDIFSNSRRYISMIITFMLGLILIIIPVNAFSTLDSSQMMTFFGLPESEIIMTEENSTEITTDYKEHVLNSFDSVKKTLDENGLLTDDFEISQTLTIQGMIKFGDNSIKPLIHQTLGDIHAEDFDYIEGTAPVNTGEIAVTPYVSETLNAKIGDFVTVDFGGGEKEFLLTGIFQSMNNWPGNTARVNENEYLSTEKMMSFTGIQMNFNDNNNTDSRIEKLNEIFPNFNIETGKEVVKSYTGDVTGYIDSVTRVTLLIVVIVNALMASLMVTSFISDEKNDIAALKAIGFSNNSLIAWQTTRICIIFVIAGLLGIILQIPLGQLALSYAFGIMGVSELTLTVDIMKVFVYYPLLILIITGLAAFISAGRLRGINAIEVNSIE
jgi:putative ABC transport system permease protein